MATSTNHPGFNKTAWAYTSESMDLETLKPTLSMDPNLKRNAQAVKDTTKNDGDDSTCTQVSRTPPSLYINIEELM